MNRLIFIVFSVLFIICSLCRVNGFEFLYTMISPTIVLLFFLLFQNNSFKLKFKGSHMFLLYFFVLLSSISSLINEDLTLIVNSFTIGMTILICVSLLPTQNFNISKTLFWSVIITHFPMIILPILLDGLSTSRYSGIFYNPNTFGNIAATLFSVILPVYLMNIQRSIEGLRNRNFVRTLCTVSLAFLLFMVVASGSRTSFISVVFMLLFGFLILGFYLVKTKKVIPFILKGGFFTLMISAISFVIFKFTNFYYYVQFNIINKFMVKYQSGDVLDSRGYIWETTLREGTLFGHGSNYFSNFDFGSHNTFIRFIGTVGYIPSLFLFVLLLAFLFLSLKRSLWPSESLFKYSPFIIGLNFIALSLAEDMSYKLAMFLFLFSVGGIIANKPKLLSKGSMS